MLLLLLVGVRLFRAAGTSLDDKPLLIGKDNDGDGDKMSKRIIKQH